MRCHPVISSASYVALGVCACIACSRTIPETPEETRPASELGLPSPQAAVETLQRSSPVVDAHSRPRVHETVLPYDGGESEIGIEFSLAEDAADAETESGPSFVVTLKNSSEQDLAIAVALQIIDIAGADVATPIAVEAVDFQAGSQAAPSVVGCEPLPDGYYIALVTALADSDEGEVIESQQLFLQVKEGTAEEVDYKTWYLESGMERFGESA